MKTLIFQKENYSTLDADDLCTELEQELGVTLRANGTKIVNGYLETSEDGTIKVCLYEQGDKEFIDALPEDKKNSEITIEPCEIV